MCTDTFKKEIKMKIKQDLTCFKRKIINIYTIHKTIVRYKKENINTVKTFKEKNSNLLLVTMNISIEGNIGVGKSTIIKKLSENKIFKCIQEPIQEWINLGGYNLLDLFYKDPEKHCSIFQFYTMLTLFNDRKKMYDEKYVIFERSLNSSINVFCKSLLENNILKNIDYLVLKEYFLVLEKLSPKVSLFGMYTIDPLFILHNKIV